MRGDFLKSKAVFMAFIIVFSIFTISGIKEVSAEQNVCCEQTETDWCVYTGDENCLSTGNAATSCEQTSYCKGGCCVSEVGKCSKNVPKAKFENTDGYIWQEGASCDVDVCEKNCCVIAEYQCSYTTEDHCEYLIKDLEDIEKDFRDVDSEYECTDICTNSDKGCCVTDDSCTYGSRGECEIPDLDINTGNGFYKERYCSGLGYCSYCEPHDSTACVADDVYWFDSCGNQEEEMEDCDYLEGDWCGYDDDGNAFCKSVECKDTFDGVYYVDANDPGEVGEGVDRNVHSEDRIGGEREHGESWCLYESPAGDFKDRPGSQHYRSYCYFGEEILEPCADYREEVCIQSPYGENTETGGACVTNSYSEGLINENITTVPLGSKFWSDTSTEECAVAEIDCPVLYAVSNYLDVNWQPGRNLGCLGPDWAQNMTFYCAAQGDCGAGTNVVGVFTDDGFYMTNSQSFITAGGENETGDFYRHRTYVGYDSCIENVDPDPETGERFCDGGDMYCIEDDDGAYDPENCIFIDGTEKIYEVSDDFDYTFNGEWISKYGVFGGLLGLSEIIESETSESGLGTSLGMIIGIAAINVGTAAFVGATMAGSVAAAGGINAIPENFFQAMFAKGAVDKNWVSAGAGKNAIGVSTIANVVAIVTAVATVVASFTDIFTEDDPLASLQKSESAAMSAYIGGGVSALMFILPSVIQGGATTGPIGALVAAVILIVAAILMGGGKTKEVTISSHCEMWQPPTGSDYCELCDISVTEGGLAIDDGAGNILKGYDCTEYKCKSLGWNCEYIDENSGTDRPKCIGVETNDVNHPEVIDAYVIDSTPDVVGEFDRDDYLIVDQKVNPYTFFSFGIETDEPSQCKIEQNLSNTYDDMEMNFPDSYYDYVHNQSWILTPEDEFTFYVRCQDKNGNWNIDAFVVQVETGKGEDITPPSIEATSINNNGYVPYGVNETPISIYINEPADCRWDSVDVDYSMMSQPFLCQGTTDSVLNYFDDECLGVLNVTDYENNYYFACNDSSGNSNTENYAFTLYGTDPLLIDLTSPNGTLYTDQTVLYVETSEGADGGVSVCSYGGIEFFESNYSVHQQTLEDLTTGSYSYGIDCVDVAGNMNATTINFEIAVDEEAPDITSLYLQENTVYVDFDETVSCEYYFESFSFGSGTSFSSSFALVDGTSDYYIICQDEYENEASFVVSV